jgi:hypothetical protein
VSLSKSQSELVAFLFEERSSDIAAPLTRWIATSPRYTSFVEKYKDKIRKKLRITRATSAAADLYYELQIPFWLLQEERFDVAYEPYAAGKTRGPDYAVSYRTNFTFNIEVTHMRGVHLSPELSPAGKTVINTRLVDVVCNKLGQMLANMANLLFVVSDPGLDEPLHLAAHIAWIKDRAEHSDPAFYERQGFLNTSDFIKYYERLAGIVLYGIAESQRVNLWLNPQAMVKLTGSVTNILRGGLFGELK